MIRTGNKLLLPCAGGAALLMCIVLWISFEFMDVLFQKQQRQQYAADSAFTFLQQGLATDPREAQLRLPHLLRLASESGDFQYAATLDLNGKIIAESGSLYGDTHLPALDKPNGRFKKGRCAFFWHTLVLPSGAAQELQKLKFVLVAQAQRQEIGGSPTARLLFGLLILGVLATSAVMIAWHSFTRNRQLKGELGIAHERREQIEELGLAAAGLAHETKNPLGLIRGCAQQIADGEIAPEECRRMAREIMEEADVTSARLGDFLNYARLRPPELREIDAKAQIGRSIELLRDEFADAGVALGSSIPGLSISADPEMLSQILLNLLLNSLKSTPKGGRVSVALTPEADRQAILTVADTGTGIPEELLPNLFKPYVSRRAGGCGLGLAIVKRIAEQSGWRISVDSKPNVGTCMQISGIKVINHEKRK